MKRIAIFLALSAVAVSGAAFAVDSATRPGVYRLEIKIGAPPEFLYPYLIEEDRIARWNQDKSVTVTFPRGIEPRIGKQIHVAIAAPTDPWLLMEIVVLNPGREVRTRLIGGILDGDFAYLLSPDGAGGTALAHEMRIRPKGALATLVWELYGKRLHRAKMRAFMAKMKEVVEGDWRARPR